MRPLNKKVKIALLISLLSMPIVLGIESILWKMGVFDFGTNLSQISFGDIVSDLFISSIPIMLIDFVVLGYYVYNYCYLKIKKYGIGYIETIAQKTKKDLVIAYGIVILVVLLSPLFPNYASLFIPLTLFLLCPSTVFVFLIGKTDE